MENVQYGSLLDLTLIIGGKDIIFVNGYVNQNFLEKLGQSYTVHLIKEKLLFRTFQLFCNVTVRSMGIT
jgi:hypothetical protein